MTHFATVSSVQADVKDLQKLLPIYNRLWIRTKDEWYSEQASIIRALMDKEQNLLKGVSWADRIMDKQIGTYGKGR